jgi:ParB family chromosome partitioning protein
MPRPKLVTQTPPPAVIDTETRHIPLDQLYLHPLNPRRELPAADIEALANSIEAAGLLQNLSGFADPEKIFRDGFPAVGIVGGGRRLRALQMLAARGDWTADVPVRVTADADTARLWAGTENETVAGLPVADRIVAYRQMRDTGASIAAIAAAFAKSPSDVSRLLALARLPEPVIGALREGSISFDTAKLLTTARDDDSRDALFRALIAKDLPEWQLRDRLRQKDIPAHRGAAVYVGLDAYYSAGGSSTVDLFADNIWLHDADLIDRLCTEKAEAETQTLRTTEGWAWAQYVPGNTWQFHSDLALVNGDRVALPDGDQTRLEALCDMEDRNDTELAELEALELRAATRIFTDADYATCGITTTVTTDGTLTVNRAWRRKSDATVMAEDGSIATHPTAPEAGMPQNLRDDLRHIRLICIQHALRRDPDLCQRMLAMQLAGLCPPYQEPFNFAPGSGYAYPAAGLPSKTDGFHVPAQLAPKVRDISMKIDTSVLSGGPTIAALVTNGLARAFCRTEGHLVDAIHARQPITPREIWHPTAAGFLSRVSAGYLDSLFRDLTPDDGSRHAGFAIMTKKQKAAELERLFNDASTREAYGLDRETNTRIDAWLPEELRFATPDGVETESGAGK